MRWILTFSSLRFAKGFCLLHVSPCVAGVGWPEGANREIVEMQHKADPSGLLIPASAAEQTVGSKLPSAKGQCYTGKRCQNKMLEHQHVFCCQGRATAWPAGKAYSLF